MTGDWPDVPLKEALNHIFGTENVFEEEDLGPKCWYGDVPERCQVSGRVLDGEFVDGSVRTMGGRWGIMHPDVHKEHGNGLGTGRGQLYRINAAGVWVKVAG